MEDLRRPLRRTCVDDDGLWHEVIWLHDVAFVLRCTGELPGYRRYGHATQAVTCLWCIGAARCR